MDVVTGTYGAVTVRGVKAFSVFVRSLPCITSTFIVIAAFALCFRAAVTPGGKVEGDSTLFEIAFGVEAVLTHTSQDSLMALVHPACQVSEELTRSRIFSALTGAVFGVLVLLRFPYAMVAVSVLLVATEWV